MATSLHRIATRSRHAARLFSTDALVETRPGEIGKVAGIPEEHLRRKVVIYSPARTASQQGSGKVGRWKINFLSTQKWENPLMGWTSTGDPYSHVGDSALSFESADAARDFALRHGWDYEVDPKISNRSSFSSRAYAVGLAWIMGVSALQKCIGSLGSMEASGVGSSSSYSPKDLNKEIIPEKVGINL